MARLGHFWFILRVRLSGQFFGSISVSTTDTRHQKEDSGQWTVAAGCGPPTFLHRFPKNICIWKQHPHLPPSKKDRDADKDLGDLLLGSGSGSPSIAFTFPARLYFYCQPNVPQVASWWWPVQWLKERVRVPHLIL